MLILLAVAAVAYSSDGAGQGGALAQARVSPTPIRVQIASATPEILGQPTPVPTFTPLPTLPQAAFLRVAPNIEGSVNVRAQADPNAALLGVINPGEEYLVTGRFFMWYRFRYENSPNNQGWVFSELVEVFGDPSLIPDLSLEPEATTDATVVGATQTWEVILLTPGGDLTATANSRLLIDPVGVERSFSEEGGSVSGLPTFTPPPNIALPATPAPQVGTGTDERVGVASASSSTSDSGIPPALPIILLGGLGLLGLFISTLRR